ncbi:MAG: GNAT family N-acetyltransferase [Spirochaetales bacterium]|nr:GNAT family N-acetyltransferase [Spirochaetales bacterium]
MEDAEIHKSLDSIALKELASLHRSALPDSLLSLLGRRAIQSYYQFVSASPSESLILVGSSPILGCCVLSFAPATLMGRFLRSNPWRHGLFAILSLVQAKAFTRMIRTLFHFRDTFPGEMESLPEVVQLFVAGESRSSGIGYRLLKKAEEQLHQRGAGGYFVKTQTEAGNRAIGFYKKNGFTLRGEVFLQGQHFQILAKDLEGLGRPRRPAP